MNQDSTYITQNQKGNLFEIFQNNYLFWVTFWFHTTTLKSCNVFIRGKRKQKKVKETQINENRTQDKRKIARLKNPKGKVRTKNKIKSIKCIQKENKMKDEKGKGKGGKEGSMKLGTCLMHKLM